MWLAEILLTAFLLLLSILILYLCISIYCMVDRLLTKVADYLYQITFGRKEGE